jgi:hypothetical protein
MMSDNYAGNRDPDLWPPPTDDELRGHAAERREDEELWKRRLAGRWGRWPRDRDET